MGYDDGELQPNTYVSYGFKKKLGLKGKYAWNILYGIALWQVFFVVIFGFISFILWDVLWNGWMFMFWRATIEFGIIMGLLWIYFDWKSVQDEMKLVADRL